MTKHGIDFDPESAAKEFISYAVLMHKSGLISVLSKNGYKLGNNPSDKEVTIAILQAQKDPKVRKDLATFLTSLAPKAAQHVSFTGGFFNADGSSPYALPELNASPVGYTLPTPTPTSTSGSNVGMSNTISTSDLSTKKKTAVGSILSNIGNFLKTNVFTPQTVNGLLQAGLTSLNNKVQGNANQLQAQTNQLQQQQQALLQNIPQAKQSNTATYIFIGVGVIALGTIIYLVSKK